MALVKSFHGRFYLGLNVAFAGIALPLLAQAVVFGATDSRQELFQLPAQWQNAAHSTVAIIPMQKLGKISDTQWKTFTNGVSLVSNPYFNPLVNPAQRFGQEASVVECTGFLVAPDVMVTASHCLSVAQEPSAFYYDIVAGFGYETASSLAATPLDITLSDDQVTTVKEVLYQGTPTDAGIISDSDYAILRLKKPLLTATPFALKVNQAVHYADAIVEFGHPLGLPLKADLSGTIAQAAGPTQKLILSFTDMGEGASGGPVVDPTTQAVIAIQIAGSADWLECPDAQNEYITWSCESHRPETVAQILADSSIPDSIKRQYQNKFPGGVITSFANRALKIDQVAAKLDELQISYQKK